MWTPCHISPYFAISISNNTTHSLRKASKIKCAMGSELAYYPWQNRSTAREGAAELASPDRDHNKGNGEPVAGRRIGEGEARRQRWLTAVVVVGLTVTAL